MSVDSKESSSKEVKVEDETIVPEESGVGNATESKSTGKTISKKKLFDRNHYVTRNQSILST